ncbi:hypothetical protein SLG_22360 [Sphingobium sp. SYK-6]|uniref:hypothetical protein n=1 Tax=Sphingobium sp. (strain NBRC 103272 / SYK-6) TaxID=627192 RepID=UPI000227714B|nr:hypothetical protein [Sphingobium sp. SYK-6]BAK66911.1 hypothetical protein SLG_22360 [Sphingobium sp. SYK-6]
MVAHLEDVERLFNAVKNLRDERRKMQKLSDRALHAEGPKASQKANVNLNWQAFHINKIEHAVHAAAVDCGYADIRSTEHYRPYSVKLTGFHEYEVVPDKPRCLKEGAAVTTQLTAGIELAAKFVEKRRDEYVQEHGSYDPSTGVTEFPGNGDEYVDELEEIIEGIRAVKS